MRHAVAAGSFLLMGLIASLLALHSNGAVAEADEAAPARDRLVNRRAMASTAIAADRITGRLQQAWVVERATNVTGQPLVEGGTIYAADWGGNVFAVEAATGRVLWDKAVHVPKKEWSWYGFSGTGDLVGELVYQASTEGTAYAIDKKTGDVRWKTRFATNPNSGNCGKILVADGLVYIGLSSVEEGLALQSGFKITMIGEVVALDALTGKEAWRRPLTEAPSTGVAVWSGFAFDVQTRTLFFTTGNNYTGKPTALSDSIVAADAKTGAIKWSRQVTQGDVWNLADMIGPDFDFGAPPQLLEATIDGKARALVAAGDKGGAYVACDRTTGELVWRAQLGAGQIAGGFMAEGAIRDGRIYLWSNNNYSPFEAGPHTMDVAALDTASGRKIWIKAKAQPPAATTAGLLLGDVYFVSSTDGRVRGYRASDGTPVWTSEEYASIGSGLAADETSLYFGTGIPKDLGGKEGKLALVAYRVGASSAGGR